MFLGRQLNFSKLIFLHVKVSTNNIFNPTGKFCKFESILLQLIYKQVIDSGR